MRDRNYGKAGMSRNILSEENDRRAKRIQYDKDMFDERRYNGEINAAKKEGREEGREKGRLEANKETARNLKLLGVDVEIIAQATGLAVEEIKEL